MSIQSEKTSPEITLQSLLKVTQEAQDIKSIKRVLHKHIMGVFQVEMAAIFIV